MEHSNRLTDKPAKPYPDFPLFPHDTRRWAKKVRGKMHYFGPWEDWKGALAKWEASRDYLMTGRTPPPAESIGGLTLRDLANAFRTAKLQAVEAGHLSPRTYRDYVETIDELISLMASGVNHNRMAADIRPEDFARHWSQLAKRMGPVTLGNEVQRIRSIFKFGYENDLLDRPIKFGSAFKKPSRKIVRESQRKNESHFIPAEQVRAIMDAATPQIKTMVLLAVNCGLGNTDVSELDWRHLDLDAGLLDFPRPKTQIDRRATLWPETVKALRDLREWSKSKQTTGEARGKVRYRPSNPEDADAVFLTQQQVRFVRHTEKTIVDTVGLQFGKLLRKVTVKESGKSVSIKKDGVNFYSLRHVFETVAGATKDQAAVDRIMGHTDPSMGATYRIWSKDATENERLRAVTDHVRLWLWPDLAAEAPKPGVSSRAAK